VHLAVFNVDEFVFGLVRCILASTLMF